MSSINLNVGASAFEQLRAINTMAQSTSGSISGRIGLINQANGQARVIKFNTHIGERLFGAAKTADMQSSCDELRERICGLLDTLAKEGKIGAELCEKLKASVNNGKSKKLLDRSIVANVIKDVETAANTNRKEGDRLVSLHGSEYDMYDSVSTDRQTDFDTVISGGEVKPKTITVEKKAPDSARFGKTTEEIKKNIRYNDNLKLPSEEKLDKMGWNSKKSAVSKSLVNDLKRVEFDDELKEDLKKVDIKLQTQKDFKDRIEDVNSTKHATTKATFDDFFEVVQGGTADVAKKVLDAELAKDPDAVKNNKVRLAAQIFADNTLFLCGIDDGWTTQEEALAYATNNKAFQKLIADGKVELCNIGTEKSPTWRWKYVDGDGALSAVDSYIFKGQLERTGNLNKLDQPIDLDWDFAAMPSLRTDGEHRDIRGNLEYLCKCRGIPASPMTAQLENAKKFIETLVDQLDKKKALGEGDGNTNKLVKEAMKLLMFAGDNDGFKIFSDKPEQEAQKLIDLVKSGKCNEKGADGLSLLDKANANYKSTLLKVVSGWVATARERGVTHFIGGAAGLGAFANDEDVVADALAEAFAKHGGDMKFVYAQYEIGVDAKAEKFKQRFMARFKEIRTRQPQTGNVGNAGEIPPPQQSDEEKFAKVMEDFDLEDVDRVAVYEKTTDAAGTVSENIKKILDGDLLVNKKTASLETYLNGLYRMLFDGPKGSKVDNDAQRVIRDDLDELKKVAEKLSSKDKSVMQDGIKKLRERLESAMKYWINRQSSPIQGGQNAYREFLTSLELGLSS